MCRRVVRSFASMARAPATEPGPVHRKLVRQLSSRGISSVRLTTPATMNEFATKNAADDRRIAGHSCPRSRGPGVPPARWKMRPAMADETDSSAALNRTRTTGGRPPRRRIDAATPEMAAVTTAAGVPSRSRVANTNVKAIETLPRTGSGIRNGDDTTAAAIATRSGRRAGRSPRTNDAARAATPAAQTQKMYSRTYAFRLATPQRLRPPGGDSITFWISGSGVPAADGGGRERVLYSKHVAGRPFAMPGAVRAMSSRSGGKRAGGAPPGGKPNVGLPHGGAGAPSGRGPRLRLILSLLVAALGAWLAWASIVRVGAEERVFRRTALAGTATRLTPRRHVVVPLLQRLVRVPEGAVRAESSVRVRSREGVDLEIPFEVTFQMDDQALAAPRARRADRGTPPAPDRPSGT